MRFVSSAISGKEELFWQAKEQILFQWFCFSVERYERHLVWKNILHPPWIPLHTTINTFNNPPLHTPTLKISEDDVRQVFRENKRRKAPGPDGVSPVCLKSSADQLAPIFTKIFNRSLELCEVPSCFKCSTIIPYQRNTTLLGLRTTNLWF